MTEKILNAKQAAERLGVSRKTLYSLMERGKLTPVETPDFLEKRPRLQFRESEINRLLHKDEKPAA